MGSPITAMLAQAAPAAGGTVRNEDVERDARIKALLAQVAANQQADPSLMAQPAPSPSPSPTPAAPASPGVMGTISNFLMSLLPSTQSLAPKPAATPAPVDPTLMAAEEEKRRRLFAGQQ